MLQDVNYTRVTPVRYKRLSEGCNGICISNHWLLASLYQIIRVYRLPHLDPGHEIQISGSRYPRAGVDGSIYVPGTDGVSILKIHNSGHVTLVRNLTGEGSVSNVRAVVLGPLKGELCVAFSEKLLVLNIKDDTVARSLHSPKLMSVHSLAVDSGQILVTYGFIKDRLYDLFDMAMEGNINWFDGVRSETREKVLMACENSTCRGHARRLMLELEDLRDISDTILQTLRQRLIRHIFDSVESFRTFTLLRMGRSIPETSFARRLRRSLGSTHLTRFIRSKIEQTMQDLSQPAHLAVYSGPVLTSPLLTTDSLAGITASNGRFFVVDNQHSNVHIYNRTGSLRYTIESVNGRHGLWLTGLTDVAVWQDCLWLVTRSGHLVLLCPA